MKRTGLLTFNGGMNNVKPIHLLAESEAALVQNLYLSDTGMWTDIGKPEVLANEGTGVLKRAHKIVYWKPAITLADAIDDFVYIVFYTTGEVKLVYRYQVHESKEWKSHLLKEDVSYQDVQVAFDDNQFLWVDGRINSKTVRVVIDADGAIKVSIIGVVRPLYKPEVVGVGFSNKNDEGTGIKRGKIFLICYTYVNDREDESNPSPVAVVDDLQYYSRGYYEKGGEQYYYPITGGKYYHDNNITGSITNIDIKAKVDYDGIRRINVYLAEADYPETVIPPTGFRLITSKIVPRKTSIADVVIAMPASMIIASYENDTAPKGDAITLTGGTAFIGNSVNDLGLPHPVAEIWRITLSNLNKFNYTNRWIRIDLFTENIRDMITQDVVEGIPDWRLEDIKLFRMIDSDMITPLELFYYEEPGTDVHRIHKKIEVSRGGIAGTKAYTDIYLPIPDKAYRVEAVNAGALGNDYILEMKRGTLRADLLIDEDSGDIITVIAKKHIDNIGIKLIAPGTMSSLKLDLKEDVPKEYRIEITLGTDMHGEVYSTAGDIVNLIIAEIAGTLSGIVSSVDTPSYGTFDSYRVLSDDNNMDESQLFECSTTAEIIANYIIVYLGYKVADGAITATMADVANAINNTPDVNDAVSFVSTEQLEAMAIVLAQQQFTGGADPIDSQVASGDQILTSMLSWIRIPQIPAYQDKSIYLVKFAESPTKVDNEFVPLVVRNPIGNQLLLSRFYRDKFVRNPIPNEETYVASGYDISDILQLDNTEMEGYAKKNAASLLTPIEGIENDLSIIISEIIRYDERANGTFGGAAAVRHNVNALNRNIMNRRFSCGANLVEKGYMWGSTVIPNSVEVPNNAKIYICNLSAEVIVELHVLEIPLISAYIRQHNNDWRLYIEVPNSATIMIPLDGSLGITAGVGERIHVVVSWDGDKMYDGVPSGSSYSSFQKISVGILARGQFKGFSFYAVNNIDTSKKMAYVDRTKYPAMFGLRTGVALKDDWQLLSVLRTMPLFPTSSIGALDKFEVLVYPDQPNGIVYINNNITIEKMSTIQDTSPGRIQWGAYGVMPDLNEYNIHEDIMGLCPIKSFQPTDEHNTILVFTRENTYILALLGDSANSCTVIKQLNGIGLVERGALCATHTGVAWLSQQGIMHITSEGTENLTRGRIDVKHITSLIYDTERNWLWARGKDSQGNQHTYVYQLYEMLWWQYSGSVHPDDFVGTLDDNLAWVCYADKNIYKEGSVGYAKDEHNPTLIKTRAIALQKKLSRIKLIGDLRGGQYKLKARLYSDKITEYKETGDFDTNMNSPTAIPGLAADYVQLDIKETNKAIALSLEYEDGVKR